VSQKKKVYRTDQTTFIMGETPKGIRRYGSVRAPDAKNNQQKQHLPLVKY
jgi:hypothetical protein